MNSLAKVCTAMLAVGAAALSIGAEHQVSSPEHASPSAQAEPGLFTREFGNSAVTVLRIRIPAHARIPQHEVSPRVVVWLTDAHLRLTFSNGTQREEKYRAGQTCWVTAQQHAGENLDNHPIEFVAIIPSAAPQGNDNQTATPSCSR